MRWHQLKVVLWKNYIIRKRHWLLTIIEFLLPTLLFIILAYILRLLELRNSSHSSVYYKELEEIKYEYFNWYGSSKRVTYCYTPETEFYRDIMTRVQHKFPINETKVEYKGFPSTKQIMDYHNDNSNQDAYIVAIIFNGNNPKKLDYTIRVPDEVFSYTRVNTEQLYSSDYYTSTSMPYFYEKFLRLQKALDMSFIEKTSGKDLESNITIWTQSFPSVSYLETIYYEIVFTIVLPILTLFSFIFICPAVLKRVVDEKASGIKELMKLVGMKSWMLWLGWLIHGMMPMLFSAIFIIILLKLPVFGAHELLLNHTNGLILFVFLLLYCIAAITFCFAISSFFTKPTMAMVVGILLWILSYFLPKYSLGLDTISGKLPWAMNMLLLLLPNMSLHYAYLAISQYEERELKMQWNNFYKSNSGGRDDVTMLNIWIMLLIDAVIYTAFTLYMDNVNPGKYGVRKSFLYPIHKLIRLVKKRQRVDEQFLIEPVNLSHVEEGEGLSRGIELRDVVKRYGNKVAVNELTLSIYRNQITVLLGHNGAGKSTTMSMITGMLDATSGTIKVNGKDVKEDMEEIRESLGLCPQHNLLFTDLTVGEHLVFFAKLKGKTGKEAEDEMLDILNNLHMSEKGDSMANTLSGGMKRKLCLGMALTGGSKTLVLDEPTSGMDPESRRKLWDLLLSWRGERTILITTHFMEEADALGDWIAIMAEGKLQCYGTPLYLKKEYDTGYHLSLMVNDGATTEERDHIKNCITDRMVSARLKDCDGNNMVFLLMLEHNSKIADLLSFLEDNKELLKIENLSITVTTLEDVFLKVKPDGNDPDPRSTAATEIQALLDTQDSNATSSCSKTAGALIIKKLQFYKRKFWICLIPVIIAMLFLVIAVCFSADRPDESKKSPELKLRLSAYKETTTYYNGTARNDVIDKMKAVYKSLIEDNKGTAIEVTNVQEEMAKRGTDNIIFYRERLVVGAEFRWNGSYQATALYNGMSVHSAPISLNLITNALAKTFLGNDYSITAGNWPLESKRDSSFWEYSEVKVVLLWSVLVPIGFLLIVGSFILFPHSELSTKFLHIQYMCGVNLWVYWSVNYLIDFIFYIIVCLIMTTIAFVAVPYIGGTEYLILLFILALYGIANIPYAYLFSRRETAAGGYAVFVIISILFGIVFTIIITIVTLLEGTSRGQVGEKHQILRLVFLFALPQVGLAYSLIFFFGLVIYNYNSNLECVETGRCGDYKEYFPFMIDHIVCMILAGILYISLNVFMGTYTFKEYLSKINPARSLFYRNRDQYQNLTVSESNDFHCNSLKARNLRKTYSRKLVVKNISFTLEEKECLGILGVNGAGKTTMFGLLTREAVPDSGNVKITRLNKKPVNFNQSEYLHNLGYCPQADALNFALTGRQILTLVAKLRGSNDPETVNKFLKLFELQQYADMPCGHYSGGNKRKLSLAIALIGFPKYVLLDEPTNGVDPSSRRKFWNLIRAFKENKDLSFILTSHSMVECEALCNNLKIMKDGIFEKEGTISDLKKEHGGFSIKLKLINKDTKTEEVYNKTSVDVLVNDLFNNVEELKSYFKEKYNGTVKDEHSGLLHIYVEDKNKKWSTIFKEVEGLKTRNPHLIEDYAISEASLEDIFLTVARGDEEAEGKKSKKKIYVYNKKDDLV